MYEDTSILTRYLELKERESILKEEMDNAKAALYDFLTDQPDNRYEGFKGFDFTVQTRKTWEYSDALKVQMENLAAAKKHEERNGIAKLQRESGFPVVKAARNL